MPVICQRASGPTMVSLALAEPTTLVMLAMVCPTKEAVAAVKSTVMGPARLE